MPRRLLLVLSLALAACGYEVRDLDDGGDGCFGACEEPPPVNRLEVEGRVCVGSERVVRMHKVLVLLDRSGSWQFTDPANAHFQALTSLLDQTVGRVDVEVGIIAFNAGMEVTPFTNDRSTVDAALANAFASGLTDIQGALATAAQLLEQDMLESSIVSRARTTYEILLIGDGTPNPICQAGCDNDPTCLGYCDGLGNPEDIEGLFVDLTACGDYNTDEQLLGYVDQIRALQQTHRVGAVRLHTAFVYGPESPFPPPCDGVPPYDRAVAEDLFARLAEHGGGQATSSDASEGVELPAFDLGPLDPDPETRELAILHAWNLSDGPDSDGDGLTDGEEGTAGSDPFQPDTDGDGHHDFLERQLSEDGWDPLDSSAPEGGCAERADTDGDQLPDCDELAIGTDPCLFDTDFDLISDGEEVLSGTSPLQDDMSSDLDFDGADNGEELATGLDPTRADAERWASQAHRIAVREDGDGCYAFAVTNIGLATTAASSPDGRAGWNTILVELVESYPEDAPWQIGVPRAACVNARLQDIVREPASGRVTLGDDDFRPLAELDLADCAGEPRP
jgi:hypothetical protein